MSCKKEEVEVAAPQKSEVDGSAFLESLNGSTNNAASTTSTQNAVNPVSNQNQTGKSGINPAHGQPGHRCDISVGAPLNSTPIQANPSTSSTINNKVDVPSNVTKQDIPTSKSTPTTISNGTVKGMNPPHGQEGHVCSVAVGAPLPAN